MLVPELTGKGSLGPLLAQDPVLIRSELGPPLGVRLDDCRCDLGVTHDGSIGRQCCTTMKGCSARAGAPVKLPTTRATGRSRPARRSRAFPGRNSPGPPGTQPGSPADPADSSC